MSLVSDIKLIRSDSTTLDLSHKAEKGMLTQVRVALLCRTSTTSLTSSLSNSAACVANARVSRNILSLLS
jgi:hypothetical protein